METGMKLEMRDRDGNEEGADEDGEWILGLRWRWKQEWEWR